MIPILGSLIDLGGTYLKGKQDEAKAKAEAAIVGIQAKADIEKAKAISATKLAEAGQSQNYDLDRMAMGISVVVSYLVLLSWEAVAVMNGAERDLEWSN